MKSGKKNLDNLSKSNRWKLLTLMTVGFTLLTTSIILAVIDPGLILARYNLRMGKGTVLYDLLSKEMAGALVETYIFNITNAERFMSGEDYKLKVEEIGPFTYQEYRAHDDLFLDEDTETLRYSPRLSTRFVPELSIADPMDVNVTVPNIPLLAMASKMGTYPAWTQMGFNILANRLDSRPVVTLRTHDFLWGYKDPLIALGNTLMPGWINFEKLGMLDRLYDKKAEYTLEVGASDADKFKIKTVNGENGLSMRGYDPSIRSYCNTFTNTYEGLVYPPQLTPDFPIRIYRNVFCRIMELEYTETRDMEFGPKAYVYRISNTTFMPGPDNECLCGNRDCFNGMSDLSPCFYGFQVYLSQGHLLGADPKIYERVEGLHPDFKKHGSEFVVDPNLGIVLATNFTLQLNVVVDDVSFNYRTKAFSNTVIPAFYFKIIQPQLPDETKAMFRTLYLVTPYVCLGIEVFLVTVALVLFAFSARLVYWSWLCGRNSMGFEVTKDEKETPVYVEPLIERDANFTVELIPKSQIAKPDS
ncbi:scavenger receptor class B member 1-like [Epargyreus clarus]|uniref:scavenger receptor class B member 1-like n=1 Tax=Epargyreus clarus TaxID=520877 RepID=UPI003C2D6B65